MTTPPTDRSGIRWDATRQQWIAQASAGPRGARLRKQARFPASTSRKDMAAWQRRTRIQLEDALAADPPPAAAPDLPPDTLEAAAARYLATITAMPSADSRGHDLRAWTAVLGHRPVASLTADDVAGVVNGWRGAGLAANTLNHRRTALLQCLRLTAPQCVPVLAQAVRWQTPPDDAPRAVPYALIEQLLAAMPPSRTRARLRVLAYTGIPPATLGRLAPEDVDLRSGTVRLPTRRKGRTVGGVVLPLLPQAVDAFRELAAVDGWGRYSSAGVAVSWRRALAAVTAVRTAAGQPPLPHIKPYDLRHSFATLVLEATGGDLQATMTLCQHADLTTTLRYTRARVTASAAAATSKVAAQLAVVATTGGNHGENLRKNAKNSRLPKPARRVRFP